jgi:hypothetical protein
MRQALHDMLFCVAEDVGLFCGDGQTLSHAGRPHPSTILLEEAARHAR